MCAGRIRGRSSGPRGGTGGRAARAAYAWEHRAGVTTKPTRPETGRGQTRAHRASRHESEREPDSPIASGWFDNRAQRVVRERPVSPDPAGLDQIEQRGEAASTPPWQSFIEG